jgi:hypothetical protein
MQAKLAYFCVIVPPPALSPTQDLTKAGSFVFFLIQNNGADSALSVLRRRHCRRVSIAHSLPHRIWEITLSKFVRRWVMLRVSPAARSRCFGFRRGVFNSVVLPALVIGAVANAQEGAQAPQRQEHETPTAPAQPQQPASGPPAASEVLVPNATAGTTQLPPIVVRGDTPKAKRDSPPQKPVAQSGRTTQRAAQSAPTTQQAAQDAPTPQQAALNTQMTTINEARDTNILTKIGATTYTFTREAIVSMPQGDNTPIDKLILQFRACLTILPLPIRTST